MVETTAKTRQRNRKWNDYVLEEGGGRGRVGVVKSCGGWIGSGTVEGTNRKVIHTPEVLDQDDLKPLLFLYPPTKAVSKLCCGPLVHRPVTVETKARVLQRQQAVVW